MNTTNVTVGSKKDTSKLQRARFRPGMLLESEDLELLNTYTRDLSRLLFGSLFGCGVICGLKVSTAPHCDNLRVTVTAGVALACSGDPVQVPNDVPIDLDESYRPEQNAKLWVVLCGTSKCCAPRTAICSSDDDETTSECSRERDGFEIKVLLERPTCVCGCPEPAEPPSNQSTSSNEPVNIINQGPPAMNTKVYAGSTTTTDCWCVDPTSPCYEAHYEGDCGCHCDKCSDCDCKCILLARLDRVGDTSEWKVDHRVRRFIRPVLVRDPQVYLEQHPPVTHSALRTGNTAQLVNDAAYEAANVVVRQAAEKAAQQAARQAVQQAANELGQRAADAVVKQIVQEAARQAAEEAMKKQAKEQAAAAEPELAADQQLVEQGYALEAEEQEQKISQQEGKPTSKQTKSSKSSRSGLPPHS